MRYRDVYELPMDKKPRAMPKRYEPDIVMVAKGKYDTDWKTLEAEVFFKSLLFVFGIIAFGAILMKFYEGV